MNQVRTRKARRKSQGNRVLHQGGGGDCFPCGPAVDWLRLFIRHFRSYDGGSLFQSNLTCTGKTRQRCKTKRSRYKQHPSQGYHSCLPIERVEYSPHIAVTAMSPRFTRPSHYAVVGSFEIDTSQFDLPLQKLFHLIPITYRLPEGADYSLLHLGQADDLIARLFNLGHQPIQRLRLHLAASMH